MLIEHDSLLDSLGSIALRFVSSTVRYPPISSDVFSYLRPSTALTRLSPFVPSLFLHVSVRSVLLIVFSSGPSFTSLVTSSG